MHHVAGGNAIVVLICLSSRNGIEEVHVKVSSRELSAISMPYLKADSVFVISQNNSTWAVFGLYILVRVMSISHSTPLINRYRLSPSIRESAICSGRRLEIKIDTPLVLACLFVVCRIIR